MQVIPGLTNGAQAAIKESADLSHVKELIWYLSTAKRIYSHSPGNVPNKVLYARNKTVEQTGKRPAIRHLSFGRIVKRKSVDVGPDMDYRPEAARPYTSPEEFEAEKKELMMK
ncbi:hypothetical protein PR048_002040 [Dryococelus australis]|uniref:Uncharacterized protein n=1 Tax=Dryococelus australis TaxID=614101 RepID=A0ABQ9IKL0_9NEOP|nr:hypothetical protein PR048_002040 [Dryococelus australis]